MARIFVTDQMHEATVKAFKPSQEYAADIKVHVVDREFQADKDTLWYFVDSRHYASTKLYWVDQEYLADLKVWFVDSAHQASWQKGHKLQRRL
jgi:hypothetical protein